MNNLPTFPSSSSLPVAALNGRLLQPRVKRVIHFALGPEGTNIAQASRSWSRGIGIYDKTEVILCETPETSLAGARLVTEEGVVPFFWTCAVYYALNQLFFSHPDTYPFLVSHPMPLDNMQLCVPQAMIQKEWDVDWRIASHPSPIPLVAGLGNPVVKTTSNSQAAIMCERGEVEACVTTAQAAALHGLTAVHEFGSPIMIFFGGTTQHGLKTLLGS